MYDFSGIIIFLEDKNEIYFFYIKCKSVIK